MLSLLIGLGLLTTVFGDITEDLGLTLDTNQACFADFDQDGWPDLCASGAVWHNNRARGFTKVADVGLSVAADYDNDGYPDLFSWSQQALFHNDKGKGFTRVELFGLPATVSRAACWGDFNNDGFVDLYVGGYEDWDKNITYPSFVLMNRGGLKFEVAWSDATYRTRGVTACDFDRDNDLDVYVSNYRLQPNRLFVNDGLGKFVDRAADFNVVATSPGFDGGHSIGAAWGDFDNDGEFDLFAGNFAHVDDRGDQPKSRFLKNLGKPGGYKFQDLGPCGVFYQESYASPAAADYDNDGNLDLYFTTVYGVASFGKKNFPVLFHDDGKFAFSDATLASGLAEQAPTYQAAWADYDRDGDLDLVTGGKFFLNESNSFNSKELRLFGDGKTINKSAIGTQVRIRLKDRVLTRQVEAGMGEGNQNDLVLHFGLGDYKGPITYEITWPNGKKQEVRDRAGWPTTVTVRYGRKTHASDLRDIFPDIPDNHWVFESLQNFKSSGLLIGYPDGLLRGGRPSYRQEIRVVILKCYDRLDLLLRTWRDEARVFASHRYGNMPSGATVDKRKALEDGLKDLTRYFDDLDLLRKVTPEFDPELSDIGLSARDLDARLGTWKRVVQHFRIPQPGEATRNFPDTPDNHLEYEWTQQLTNDGFLRGRKLVVQGRHVVNNLPERQYELCELLVNDVDQLLPAIVPSKLTKTSYVSDLKVMAQLIQRFEGIVWQLGRDPGLVRRKLAVIERTL